MTPGRKGPAAKVEDFIPVLEDTEPEAMRPEDMKAIFDKVIIPEQKKASRNKVKPKKGKK